VHPQIQRGTRHFRRASGTALVEFALVCIPLVVLVLGGAGVGEVLRAQVVVNDAAEEAARTAVAVRPTIGEEAAARSKARAWAEKRADEVLIERGLMPLHGWITSIEVNGDFSRGTSGNPAIVSVSIRFAYHMLLGGPLIRSLFPGGFVLLTGVAHEAIPRFTSAP
jgi:hypothetical protein